MCGPHSGSQRNPLKFMNSHHREWEGRGSRRGGAADEGLRTGGTEASRTSDS